jgi:6,7-dimethyl-8-ribityllumazine synthase
LSGASGYRFAIVVSRFNDAITDRLGDGARAALTEAGALAADVEVLSVPGAFELPQAARAAAELGRFDAVICLGCVIRGETAHFEFISGAAAHGIQQASADTGVPMSFGVLTTDTWEQAEERAGPDRTNKDLRLLRPRSRWRSWSAGFRRRRQPSAIRRESCGHRWSSSRP